MGSSSPTCLACDGHLLGSGLEELLGRLSLGKTKSDGGDDDATAIVATPLVDSSSSSSSSLGEYSS